MARKRGLRLLVLVVLVGGGAWYARSRRASVAGGTQAWPAVAPTPPVAREPVQPEPVQPESLAGPAAGPESRTAGSPQVEPVPPAEPEVPVAEPDPSLTGGFGPNVPVGSEPVEPAEPNPLFTPTEDVPPSPRPRRSVSAPPAGSATSPPDGSAPGPEFTIKGNADSMLFHGPSRPYLGRTKEGRSGGLVPPGEDLVEGTGDGHDHRVAG